jgi:hypothetical protein
MGTETSNNEVEFNLSEFLRNNKNLYEKLITRIQIKYEAEGETQGNVVDRARMRDARGRIGHGISLHEECSTANSYCTPRPPTDVSLSGEYLER